MNYAWCLEEMYADDAHQRLNFLMKAVIGFDLDGADRCSWTSDSSVISNL